MNIFGHRKQRQIEIITSIQYSVLVLAEKETNYLARQEI
jgi:hypothetical protein